MTQWPKGQRKRKKKKKGKKKKKRKNKKKEERAARRRKAALKRRENLVTKHHKTAVSRGGRSTEENIKWIIWKLHNAYNQLFTNISLEPKAIILILEKFGRKNFTEKRNPKNKSIFPKAWKKLFGNRTDKQVVEIIRTDFYILSVKPRRRLFSTFNLIPEEIVVILEQFGSNFFLKARHSKNQQLLNQSWRLLFKDKTDEEVIKDIKEEWT